MIVAIDGPAASGKSTVARALAQRLGLAYLDTGAMYRALAVEAVEQGLDLGDGAELTSLADRSEVSFEHEGGSPFPSKVLVDGRDVTGEIRSPEIDRAVSPVSAVPGVRAAMVRQQRRIASEVADTVLEGRDIGTVVFPDADVKIYLTASAQERARRRTIDMQRRGTPMSYEEVLADLVRRDAYDSSREASPMRQADDAVGLDTTGMTIEEVVAAISSLIEARRLTGHAQRS